MNLLVYFVTGTLAVQIVGILDHKVVWVSHETLEERCFTNDIL